MTLEWEEHSSISTVLFPYNKTAQYLVLLHVVVPSFVRSLVDSPPKSILHSASGHLHLQVVCTSKNGHCMPYKRKGDVSVRAQEHPSRVEIVTRTYLPYLRSCLPLMFWRSSAFHIVQKYALLPFAECTLVVPHLPCCCSCWPQHLAQLHYTSY